MIRATLLGTGGSAGVPMIGGVDGHGDWGACDPAEARNGRTRTSIHIEGRAGGLLVDTGPDLRAQLLSCGISRVEAVLYTHAHADHITGLDDVRILNRIAGIPLPAYATEATLADLQVRFPYAFRPWKPPGFYRPVLVPQLVVPGQRITAAGMDVQLFEQDHGFTRTLGLRIGDFAYSTDLVALGAAAMACLEGLDTWVVSCFQIAPHQTHAQLAQVLAWVRALRPRRTILTHMGVEMDWATLRNTLPPGVEPGYDGMVITPSS
jgi:phosphoribosyl 1,2-cyclic phosphate phosphodiesterase